MISYAPLGTQPSDNASMDASYSNTFITQLFNFDQPGWNPLISTATLSTAVQLFPFGAFARNSDIMQIPYFGAYVVVRAGTTTAGNPISKSAG